MRRDESTTADEAADELSREIKGKTIIITGPSAGSVGIVAATAIARRDPTSLILAGRSQTKYAPCLHCLNTEAERS